MAQIRLGTAGWTDKTLIDSGWYPKDANTPEKRLRYYASQFPLVEVDSTYYALPAEQTAATWRDRTPAEFIFNIKAFSLFTQHPTPVKAMPADLREAAAGETGKERVYLKDVDPAVADQAWDRFFAALEPLREAGKLGAILLQFPPWFPISRANKDYIVACAERAAPRRVCVEFRNHTWMTDDNQKETLDFLVPPSACRTCAWTCRRGTRTPSRRWWPPPATWPWSACTAIRTSGRARASRNGSATATAAEELDDWAAKVARLAEDAAETRWCSTTATGTTPRSTPASSPRGSEYR